MRKFSGSGSFACLGKDMRGLSLIELLVVIAIVAIFAAFAVPSYKTVQTSDRMASELNDLNDAIAFTRIAAVSRGIPVTICASSDTSVATPSCSGQASWGSGWIVFTDFNANHALDTASGDAVLRVHGALQEGDSLQGTQGTPGSFSGSLAYLTINRMGATSPGVLTLNDANGTPGNRQCLVVPLSGMVHTDTETKNPGVCP